MRGPTLFVTLYPAQTGVSGIILLSASSESDHVDLVERSHYAAAASATENAQTEAKLVGFEKNLRKIDVRRGVVA